MSAAASLLDREDVSTRNTLVLQVGKLATRTEDDARSSCTSNRPVYGTSRGQSVCRPYAIASQTASFARLMCARAAA